MRRRPESDDARVGLFGIADFAGIVDGFSAKPNVRDGRDAHPARTGGAVMTASACRKGDTAALVLSQWVFLRTSAPPSPG
jgi:hypothetical protein